MLAIDRDDAAVAQNADARCSACRRPSGKPTSTVVPSRGGCAQRIESLRAGVEKHRSQQQVFRRIAAQREFRRDHQVRAAHARARCTASRCARRCRRDRRPLIDLSDRDSHVANFIIALSVSKRLRSVEPPRDNRNQLPHASVSLSITDSPALDSRLTSGTGSSGDVRCCSHAFLHALHETGCASPSTGWAPQFLTASARRRARRRHADVSQVPFVRRIRVRLGVGRRLSPARSPVLPEAARARYRSRRRPGRASSPQTRQRAPVCSRGRSNSSRTNDCRRCTSCFRKQAKPRSARQPD